MHKKCGFKSIETAFKLIPKWIILVPELSTHMDVNCLICPILI